MRFLISIFLLSKLIFAQYDPSMYDLIKTTYERSFNRPIIYKYLNSNPDQQIKAAILSIAQSEDTSFVPELLKLDLSKYGSEICFAIAQIGKCNQSINFLWKYLEFSPPPNQISKIFFAIGKIGSEKDLNKLIEFYNSFDGPIFPFEGVSEAILQFHIHGIKSDDARVILETEITHHLSSKKRIEEALFALARYRNSQLTDKDFQNLLESEYTKDDEVFRQFVLMNVNRQINIDQNVLARLFESRSPLTKIQLVKVLHFFEIDSPTSPREIINYYSDLLYDDNQDVSLQAAISIKDIKDLLNDSLKTILKIKIDPLLFDSTKSFSFKGELFLSRFELFGNFTEHEKLLNEFALPNKYLIQFWGKNPDTQIAFNKLSDFYCNSSELKTRLESLTQILELKSDAKYLTEESKLLLNSLNSDQPSLISVAADGIDSTLIKKEASKLKQIISEQIINNQDNPDFLEVTMSLVNLSEKIDKDFYKSIVKTASSSKLYSIRKFIAEKTQNHQIGFKELYMFESIWQNAFKYEQATIKTSKGDIVIKFNSEIAPISVANFCMLVNKGFYKGIIFHRVVPGFVIQAGDPTATGWGSPGYDIVSEFSDTDFGIGYVGMASVGKDTESSQFFIMQGSHPHLDSRYTLFAKVIEGMDVLYNITEDDKILDIHIEQD